MYLCVCVCVCGVCVCCVLAHILHCSSILLYTLSKILLHLGHANQLYENLPGTLLSSLLVDIHLKIFLFLSLLTLYFA